MPSPKKRRPSGRVTAKKAMQQETFICMDPVAAGRMIELQNKRDDLKAKVRNDPDLQADLTDVLDELEEVEELVRDQTVKFVALSIGRTRWNELKAQYPPTRAQKKEFGPTLGALEWDLEAFPPVAFEQCLRIAEIDDNGKETLVELDPEDIKEMLEGETWNENEVSQLLFSVRLANESAPRVGDLGNV